MTLRRVCKYCEGRETNKDARMPYGFTTRGFFIFHYFLIHFVVNFVKSGCDSSKRGADVHHPDSVSQFIIVYKTFEILRIIRPLTYVPLAMF